MLHPFADDKPLATLCLHFLAFEGIFALHGVSDRDSSWCPHERRRILYFNVTAHPTAEWTAQQLRNAFPWDSAPRYLLRDRGRRVGDDFLRHVPTLATQQARR